jgi:DNA recombination protein RmuC
MNALLLGTVAIFIFVVAAAVFVLLFRKPQVVGELVVQTALMNEKLGRLDTVTSEMSVIRIDLGKLSERIHGVEQNHMAVGQRMDSLLATLAKTDTTADALVQTAEAIRTDLSSAKETLAELQVRSQSSQDVETRAAESIKRVESILTGTQSKGSAGENIVELVFAKLPPEWQVRNFTVANKTVEFGVRLPNGLVLPIDSKWAATDLHERFLTSDEVHEKQRLKVQIQSTVAGRATEIKKYLDPNVTTAFGIAAVPDPIYDLCSEILPDLLQQNIVLVSYSMFGPYLLLVFHTTLKTLRNVDMERLDAFLASAEESVNSLQTELQGRFSRAMIMLDNSRADMAAQLGKVSAGLAALHTRPEVFGDPSLPAKSAAR